MAAYDRREFLGGAAATTLNGALTDSDTSITIASGTGWPTGSGGKFYAVIDRGAATEEKVLITTRTTTTLANVSRGQDGTSAAAHASGVSIEHCATATDADEANYWVAELAAAVNTAGDLPVADANNSLTTLAKGSNSRVLAVDSGGTLGYTTVTSAMITDGTIVNADVGASAAIAYSKLALTGAIVNADLATNPLARANHTGTQAASTISDFAEVARDTIGTALTDGTSIDFTVDDAGDSITAEIKDAVAGAGLTVASHVLAVGAGTGISVAADAVSVDPSVISTGAWTSFTPTLTQSGAVTKTVTYAKYARIGRTIIVNVKLSVTGSGSSGEDIVAGLPVTAATSGTPFCIGHGQVFDSGNARYGVTCDLVGTSTISFWRAGDASVPGGFVGADPLYALANGDVITYSVMYEAAS